jgi:hypothetical protein
MAHFKPKYRKVMLYFSILAAYDLGAPAGLLHKIYDLEAKVQRPILIDGKDPGITVDLDNWKLYTRNRE